MNFNGEGRTDYFVNLRLVKSVPYVVRDILDCFIAPDESRYKENKIEVAWDKTSYFFGEFLNNKKQGRCMRIYKARGLYLGYCQNDR